LARTVLELPIEISFSRTYMRQNGPIDVPTVLMLAGYVKTAIINLTNQSQISPGYIYR
jgi:hypothetical protein